MKKDLRPDVLITNGDRKRDDRNRIISNGGPGRLIGGGSGDIVADGYLKFGEEEH